MTSVAKKMRVDELLNRWIVPLEKRYDYLNMSSGKKTQVPFDQLVIFSTNLQPKDLVDDAFLRRIPYKIEVPNPSEEAFRKLFEIMCPRVGLPSTPQAINYLIEKHYRPTDAPLETVILAICCCRSRTTACITAVKWNSGRSTLTSQSKMISRLCRLI